MVKETVLIAVETVIGLWQRSPGHKADFWIRLMKQSTATKGIFQLWPYFSSLKTLFYI